MCMYELCVCVCVCICVCVMCVCVCVYELCVCMCVYMCMCYVCVCVVCVCVCMCVCVCVRERERRGHHVKSVRRWGHTHPTNGRVYWLGTSSYIADHKSLVSNTLGCTSHRSWCFTKSNLLSILLSRTYMHVGSEGHEYVPLPPAHTTMALDH